MPLQPTPRREVEAAHLQHRVDKVTVQRQRNESASRVRNLGLSIEMQDGRGLAFRGRHYGVPPVPWHMALRIIAVADRLDALGKDPNPKEWKAVHREALRLFKKLSIPKNPLDRLLWPFINPLRDASHLEVATLLGFIFGCLARDCGLDLASRYHPSTSPSSTDASPTSSPSGATEKATRAAGTTSR